MVWGVGQLWMDPQNQELLSSWCSTFNFYQKWLNFIDIPMNFKQKVLHFIGVFVDFTKAFASSLLFLKRYLFLVIKHFETPPFILDDLLRSEAKIRDNFSYLTDRLTTQ